MNLPGERPGRRNSLREAMRLHLRHAKALEQITAGEFGDMSDGVMNMLRRMLEQKNGMLDNNPLDQCAGPPVMQPNVPGED